MSSKIVSGAKIKVKNMDEIQLANMAVTLLLSWYQKVTASLDGPPFTTLVFYVYGF